MINIIIPVVDNIEDAAKFVSAKKSKKYKIIVGIRKSLADKFSIKSKFVDTYVFSDSFSGASGCRPGSKASDSHHNGPGAIYPRH